MLIRWLIICLTPLLTIAAIALTAPHSQMQHLINGIILACEAAFLFKFVLFQVIKHHLRHEPQQKQQHIWLFLPIVLLIIYICHYFGAF